MSTGQRLNILEAQLNQVRGKVRQIRLNALGSGSAPGSGTPGDSSLAARMRRLDRNLASVRQSLALIGRELGSISNLLDLKERMAFRIGRENRYSARQSVRDLQARSGDIYQQLRDILSDLEDLANAAGYPTAKDRTDLAFAAIQKVSDFAGKAHEAHALLGVAGAGPQFAPAPQVTVNVSWEGLAMAAYMLAIWLKRKFGDQTKEA